MLMKLVKLLLIFKNLKDEVREIYTISLGYCAGYVFSIIWLSLVVGPMCLHAGLLHYPGCHYE